MASNHGAATSSSSYFTHDVFLSFRGEDTRHGFTDHLYNALINKGIDAFKDDPNLRVGDEIGPTLLEAIERSRMSIVVLSQNYASSSWCLDELVKIMECNKVEGRPVFPIFYRVEPSDVRHKKNQYEVAMMKHESRYGKESNRMKGWRLALFAVAGLSGEHCTLVRSENEVINKIVGQVSEKLPPKPLLIKHLGEFDSRLEEEVESLLDIESCDAIRMLGIYGAGGMSSKTTFALNLYNKINNATPKFDAACFLQNVNKKSRGVNGIENLQKTLLSEMGVEVKTKMGSTFKGSSEIKHRLGHKRVLLVLDNVDSIQQLDSLAGGCDWFGPGSRIIITTEDEDFLDKHVLDGVEIKKLCIHETELEGNKRIRSDVEEDVVGLVNDFNVVMNQLKEEGSCRNVVTIVGMGGLGKTTLARKIYNNKDVAELFPCRAWCCVSKDYRGVKVLLDLLHCLMSSASQYEDLSENELKDKIIKRLNGKKFLVVLDDVWEAEVWDKIKDVFSNNNNGSKILITSRNTEVAYHTSPRHHNLSFLNDEESWELFCKKVFWGEKCPLDLEPIGRSIVQSCGGLPLAIITLAGLLSKKKRSLEPWLKIKGCVPWYLAQDSTKLMDVLKVSYDNLPEILKPCFLYFGIYPEDYVISARELIQLWIAEGFIQPKKTRTSKVPKPEDVGEEYLQDLVDRNLVQVAKWQSNGESAKTCRIHDLLRELCISESSSNAENSLEVYTEPDNNIRSNPCRLSFLCNPQSYISSIKCDQTCTHSLFFFSEKEYSEDILRNFQSVNVLHFGRSAYFSKTPSDLKVMVHLRYLRTTRSINPSTKTPDCVWSLQNLETLDSRGWFTEDISNGIWNLDRLRHVYMQWEAKLPADNQGENNKTMWNLQTLSDVLVDPQLGFLLNNGSFPNLRKLGLRFNESTDYSLGEQLRSLQCLSNLCTLHLKSLDLTVLSLEAISFPSKLTKVTLSDVQGLDSRNMNALGQISSLQILKLLHGHRSADSLNCGDAGNFPRLKVFHMRGMINVRKLIVEEGAMHRVRSVVIRGCRVLQEVPERWLSLGNLQQVHRSLYGNKFWQTASNL